MRVLTIPQSLLVVGGLTESRPFFAIEIVEDSRIVMRRYGKRLFGKPTAFFEWSGSSVLHQHITKRLVLSLWSNDNHIIVILGSGTYQRNAAYINFLNNSRLFGTAGNSGFKRIQVNDNEVYFGNLVFLYLLHVLFQSAAAKNTSEYLRMQSFNASTQNGRICGKVFHCLAGITQRFYKLTSSAGWKEFYTFFMQFGNDFVQTFLMVNRYQSCFDSFCFRHGFAY